MRLKTLPPTCVYTSNKNTDESFVKIVFNNLHFLGSDLKSDFYVCKDYKIFNVAIYIYIKKFLKIRLF